MIPVAEALARCLDQVAVISTETVATVNANRRVLRQDAIAPRDHPPFAASIMDGYACQNSDAVSGATLRIMGEAAAGHPWEGTISQGEALRIFTGAPMPAGADRVIIQEDVTRDGDVITLGTQLSPEQFVRPIGADFTAGQTMAAPRIINSADLGLLAAMNVAEVTVSQRPKVALITTGDELVMPGATPKPGQIIASNAIALQAIVQDTGGIANVLPIAMDTRADIMAAFQQADDWRANIIVSIGGASVGDHDLLAACAVDWGAQLAFHKIAMRPGKPLIAGARGKTAYLGLPGNPVSAIVCGHLFLRPMIRKMQGRHDVAPPETRAVLTHDISANGPRAHYMRAHMTQDGVTQVVTPMDRQDSALLSVLTQANALLIRPPHDPARKAGEHVKVIPLTTSA
jgi:molybdopterin molybdotransferase